MKPEAHQKSHYLFPGMIYTSKTPTLVCTVLGSCVSVCLWDERLKLGGINHYMLPYWNGEGLALPRYGDIAIPQLVKKLENFGSRRRDLVAKVFGGAKLWGGHETIVSVGERNVDLAGEMLTDMVIPIVGQDTGQDTGRKIYFATDTGRVYLKRHQSYRERKALLEEQKKFQGLP